MRSCANFSCLQGRCADSPRQAVPHLTLFSRCAIGGKCSQRSLYPYWSISASSGRRWRNHQYGSALQQVYLVADLDVIHAVTIYIRPLQDNTIVSLGLPLQFLVDDLIRAESSDRHPWRHKFGSRYGDLRDNNHPQG